MTEMHRTSQSRKRQRTRVVVLTVAIVLLLVALLSDLGQGARDWLADLWDSFWADTATVTAPNDTSDVAATGAAARGGPSRPLSSLPSNVEALAAAAYRGQAAAAGQPKRASGTAVGGPTTTGGQAAASAGGGEGPVETEGALPVTLALADTADSGGASGGSAALGGDLGGGSGPFSTVPGGPFVNLVDGGGADLPGDRPIDTPSSVPEPGTLLLLVSAVAALGARRWRDR
jgi:hypothetical protein